MKGGLIVKKISTIIFFGAVWGIIEATLGHLLHQVSLNIGWMIWFPIAFYFMNTVYKQTGKPESIFYISIIAASIKLIDLFMPVRIDRVLNPAVSIVLEGLVVFAIIKVAQNKELITKYKYLYSLVTSFSWRILYIIYVLFLPAYFIKISPLGSMGALLRFFILESTANSIVVYLYIKFFDKTTSKESFSMEISPVMAIFQLFIALFIQWIA